MSTTDTTSLIRTEIAGANVADLAREHGTPTYVYNAEQIVRRIEELRQFDVIRYAQKACSNIAIVSLMRQQGVLVDSVSAGEIHRALAAGYQPQGDPPPIVYTADIFDRKSLDMVVEHGIHANLGSPDMIDQLGARAPGREITLRINPGFGHGHSQKTNTGGDQSKHGIWHEQIGECLSRAAQHDLRVAGLHMHIGSGTDFEHLSQVCAAMETVALQVGSSITSISAGGGLPIPYRAAEQPIDIDQYFSLWDGTRNKLQDEFGHAVSLEIEPGRYLVAESGFLLTEIRAIKQMGENTFYLVDAGFNDLARPILYGAYHPISLTPQNRSEAVAEAREVVIGGPLCESGDIFTQEEGGFVCKRELPAAQVGDLLVIECAGAYGSVMASNYNSKPLAAEVLLRDGKASVIRRRQSFDDLLRNEVIPE